MNMGGFAKLPGIFRTNWQKDGNRLGGLRHEVFVVEQNVPEELEWDEFDQGAIHFACEDENGRIIGTARLIVTGDKGTIGRLCVAGPHRHQKMATRIMDEILSYCRELKVRTCELHAQLYLQAFYEHCGFTALGNAYLEAGIEHITMRRVL